MTTPDLAALDAAPFDKQQIAHSFSAAAARYDSVAEVQRTVGGWLLQSIQRQQELASALDVGCGSGALTVELARRLPMAQVDAIDLAPGMIEVAAQQQPRTSVRWRVGDAEALPFADKTFELVYSNFVLQWCPDPALALSEMRRVLRRNGKLVLSMPGQGTLAELAAAWAAADQGLHVHPFPDADRLGELVDAAGFGHVELIERTRRVHVPDALTLMRELKTLGAHNLHPARTSTLTGKGVLQRVVAAYEARREPAGLPVTWKVLMVVARR